MSDALELIGVSASSETPGFKVGIFGGSFDPPHRGHIEIARAAKERLGLDEVWLVVAGNPYQKEVHAPAEDRLRMTELAAAGLPGIKVSRTEVDRKGPSYTIDTVKEVLRQRPDAELWLVLGADALAGIKTWHNWQELLGLVKVCVVPRRPVDLESAIAEISGMARDLVVLSLGHALPLSSTEIRKQLSLGRDVKGLHPDVLSYIRRRGLYGSSPAVQGAPAATG